MADVVDKGISPKSVAVVGCGWFGLALATHLVQDGYRVTGCKRHIDELAPLIAAGIEAFPLQLGDECDVKPDAKVLAALFQTDFLVVNIPPRLKRGNSAYLEELQQLLSLTQGWQYQCIVFISTTGVYPTQDKLMTEADAMAESSDSQVLLDAEALFLSQTNSCILRFAGLVGPKRHPGRFLAGKTDVSGANVALNLVHLNDCVRAVSAIFTASQHGLSIAPIYNLCAPQHPTKVEFYPVAAQSLGLVPPIFNQQVMPSKVILSDAIVSDLGFRYQYESPFDMLRVC
ncbi:MULTISPECIES: SDR family NAD(P)-dependent oxidoreductase [unclassified Shewanella]|uniref:SDR family NAD(P)-dependent oxidoreductase n=1 Tax=unclassified Shewanella TaxID=196818 RepID=UPI00200392E7|nr:MULTISPECIES: SDR family NAD(P)-dependent oxidoreductase [unclassified Shewanella]MCK7634321.1 SDR family NAD(P)-dependent oxidoreductase [Shewanella sp. JNE17]MCK7649460.1 SDR family NAD(P)-dependent oxidoreductase [Shewanella sp. JNE8]MCK7657627.1 SDR family NAD(P)-dependent oxidoreductase [Shewanella sp. JNE4-2]UPO29746.1 SDR family NAD(P)-dependent oxidoreductase [Shewanella sp. JNE2]